MLLDDCKQYFNTDNLYEILHVDRIATASEIKKGYYKQSIKWHPDKAASDEDSAKDATAKFQIITKAYEILCDEERRALYDESGIIDEENLSSDSINLFRRVFKKVTVEDIEKFHQQYKGSEEEESDIVTAYNSWKGDMSKIINSVYCATFEDEDRIKGIIDRNISSGVLKKTAKYQASTSAAASAKRKRKAMKEAKEAEALLEEIRAKEGAGSLEQIIQQRQLARSSDANAFVDSLAAKYGAKKKRAKK